MILWSHVFPLLLTLVFFRLERQHRLITETHDGKILLAPVSLKDGDKVLDSATGSGGLVVLR